MKKKLICVTRLIFSYVTAALMGAFILILGAYLAALVIGGETAVGINAFIAGTILPKMYLVSVITSFLGLMNMYLRGEKAFTLASGTGKKKGHSEKEKEL